MNVRASAANRYFGLIVSTLWFVCAPGAGVSAAENTTIGAVLGGSTLPTGRSDQPYLGPGFGGTSLGFVVYAERALHPSISLAGEVSLASAITGSQRQRASGGDNTLMSEHHDTLLSVVAKAKAPAAKRFQIALAGGAGFARRQTSRSGTFTSATPPFASTPVAENLTNRVFALTGGVDGIVSVHKRLALVTNVRVHRLLDDDRRPDGVVRRGVSSVVLRYGLGAQVAF